MFCNSIIAIRRNVGNNNVVMACCVKVDVVKSCGECGDEFEVWKFFEQWWVNV